MTERMACAPDYLVPVDLATDGYLETEKHFRRIMGYEQLWVLKAKLQELRELRLERLRSTPLVSDKQAATLTQEAA
jgi:hypothetical protein